MTLGAWSLYVTHDAYPACWLHRTTTYVIVAAHIGTAETLFVRMYSIQHTGSRIVVSYVNNVHCSFSSLLPHKGPLATFGEPALGSFYVKSAMCPEGTHLLTGGADNTARIWQVCGIELIFVCVVC